MKFAAVLAGGAWLLAFAGAATAQIYGAPIPPDQVLRSQPIPQTTAPPPPTAAPSIPASPPSIDPGGSNSGVRAPRSSRRSEPLPSTARDRVRDCEHQAAVDRVPRGERGGYISNCVQGE